MSEWQPTDASPMLDELVLDGLEALDDVTHPQRGRLLRRLRAARSAAELAADLDVPVTRLYHHLNALETAGLIQVVATRRVGAVTERRYQVVARRFSLDDGQLRHLDPHALAQALGGMFDLAKLELQREVESESFAVDDESDPTVLIYSQLRIDPGRRAELVARLRDVIVEFETDRDDDHGDAAGSDRFSLFVAAHTVHDG